MALICQSGPCSFPLHMLDSDHHCFSAWEIGGECCFPLHMLDHSDHHCFQRGKWGMSVVFFDKTILSDQI